MAIKLVLRICMNKFDDTSALQRSPIGGLFLYLCFSFRWIVDMFFISAIGLPVRKTKPLQKNIDSIRII